MDNTNKILKDEFLRVIRLSEILSQFLQQDSELAHLLKNPNDPNIHCSKNDTSAKEIKEMMQSRIDIYIALGHEDEPVIKATKQLVAFCGKHDSVRLFNVTFNCSKCHYYVWCGDVESQLHVICVMQGGHIPDYSLEKQIK